MEGQFYLNVDNKNVYVAKIITTFSYNHSIYAFFSFEEGNLINLHVGKVLNNGMLEAIKDEFEKKQVFEIIREKIVGGFDDSVKN